MSRATKKPRESKREARKQALTTELLEEIRREAYYLWQNRGGPHGSSWDDWFRAQEKVLSAQEASIA